MGREDDVGKVIFLYGEEPLHQSCSKEFGKDPASEKSCWKNDAYSHIQIHIIRKSKRELHWTQRDCSWHQVTNLPSIRIRKILQNEFGQ